MGKPFSVAGAEAAFAAAIPLVQRAFAEQGINQATVIVNVVYSHEDHIWALSSARPLLDEGEARRLLVNSLRVSADELQDIHGA